ncbi:MAG: hypothetical protein HOB34_06380 [Nitrospina sp.]|jgi:hypothetical protein|nr:hypothetical protein [Nitrospina sp.]MBT4556073.1 hypothetical protein [Nitrospina sp.]MBT6595707.1 hypothetical protein [Nitrospina sp.]MBT7180181.1 hypothetical protein [Nitrospina sp.]
MKRKDSANTGKKQGTKWKKGQSGNPAGKKPGTRHRATLAIEQLLDGEGEALTRKAIELAKDGDLTAIKLCLERICPPRKSRLINISLPAVNTCEGISQAQAVVVQAVGEGKIAPDEGQVLSSILEARRKSIESADHEARLNKLEEIVK